MPPETPLQSHRTCPYSATEPCHCLVKRTKQPPKIHMLILGEGTTHSLSLTTTATTRPCHPPKADCSPGSLSGT